MTIRTNVDPIVRYSHTSNGEEGEQHQEMDFLATTDAGRVFFEQQTIIEISDAIRRSMENVRRALDADRDDDSTLSSTCSLGVLDNIVASLHHHEAQEQEDGGEQTTPTNHHQHYDDDEDSLKLVEGRVRRLRERRQTKSGFSQQQVEEESDEYEIPLSPPSTSSSRPSSSWFHQHRRGAPPAMLPDILFDMEEAEDVETIGAGFESTEMDSMKLPRTSRLPRRIRRTTSRVSVFPTSNEHEECDERDDLIWWQGDDAEFEVPLAGSE